MPTHTSQSKPKHLRVWAGVVALFLAFAMGGYYVVKIQPAPQPEQAAEEEFFFIQSIDYPDWFASSTLNLPEDLSNAVNEGKQGIMLYFSREDCVCCDIMKEVNLERESIINYIQRYFNTIAVDVWGHMPLTDFDGTVYTEARFAKLKQADATPSMLFFNAKGEEIFRLRGYHDNYTFQAVLDYVLGHRGGEDFNQYQTFLQQPELFDYFELHDNKLFLAPPYQLDRSKVAGNRPLVVFFERGNCAGCDFLHTQLMTTMGIVDAFREMDLVQLDITDSTPVVTPAGEFTTSREWAEELGISYTPTLIFFGATGQQTERLDSIIALRQLDEILAEVLKNQRFVSQQ